MGKVAITICLAILIASSSCRLGGSLAQSLRNAAPPGQPSLGHYLTGINSFSFNEEINIAKSEIPNFVGITKTLNINTGGAPQPPAQVQRRVRIGRRWRVITVPVANPYAGTNLVFRPFADVENLRWGTRHQKIHLDHSIHVPGISYFKVLASVGERSGNAITYRAGYGWSYGTAQQLYNTVSVRKCRRRLFSKKCWNENVRIPRGVFPHELDLVGKGLENLVFNKIAEQAGRTLQQTEEKKKLPLPSNDKIDPKKDAVYQKLDGVAFKDIIPAIRSLVKSGRLRFSKRILTPGVRSKIVDGQGNAHELLITREGKEKKTFTIEIWTKKSLDK